MSRGIHMLRAKVKVRMAVIIKMEIGDVADCSGSLMNNLIASEISYSRPYVPKLFGPFRSCIA